MPIDTNTYLGNSNKYTQAYAQYAQIVMLPGSHVPLLEPQLNLYTHLVVGYYCEYVHLLRHGSE